MNVIALLVEAVFTKPGSNETNLEPPIVWEISIPLRPSDEATVSFELKFSNILSKSIVSKTAISLINVYGYSAPRRICSIYGSVLDLQKFDEHQRLDSASLDLRAQDDLRRVFSCSSLLSAE
jgi:hypothetical protein